jgi:vacuolar protein sorting-associated protein 45
LGGTTYEEAKEIGQRNIQMGFNEIILGGTTIHNSKTFLAELS